MFTAKVPVKTTSPSRYRDFKLSPSGCKRTQCAGEKKIL
jgi:hypothetical protein